MVLIYNFGSLSVRSKSSECQPPSFDLETPEFPEYLNKDYPDLVKSQLKQFKATTYILKSTLDSLKKRQTLTKQELSSIEPLVKDGIIAEVKASQIKLKDNHNNIIGLTVFSINIIYLHNLIFYLIHYTQEHQTHLV